MHILNKKLLPLLLCIPFLFSCGKKKELDEKERIVKLATLADIRSLDPRISNDYPSVHMIRMLYEGLMCLDSNGEIALGAAKSYEISEDQCTYTFHLRNSKWSNGDPVTAYDFEYAWKKSIDPQTAANGAYTFYVIKNAQPCLNKEIGIDEVGIRALDEKTLEVELEHPAPYFLHLCSCGTYSPINKKVDLENPGWANNWKDHLVTNGPFLLKEWKRNSEIYLEKNLTYWDAQVVKIPGILIQVINDGNTQCMLFEKGKLDWVGRPFNILPTDILLGYRKEGLLHVIDSCGVTWLFLNTQKHPFDNKNFRKAIAYALDRKMLAEHVFQLGEEPAMGILNSDISVHEKPYFEDGNILLAQEFFAKALKEMKITKEELASLRLSQRSCLATSRMVQAIQDQLRKVLGVSVEIEEADWAVHYTRVTKGDYQFGEMGWGSWLKDPIYTLDTFRNRSSSSNASYWEHSDYQKYLTLSDHETDPIKRKKFLRQAEELLMDEMPVIPICFSKIYYLKNPALKGVYVSPLQEIDFRYAYFE